MSVNGQVVQSEPGASASGDGQVLRWSARVLSADDVRRYLNGSREVILTPRTIVTPLATEHLRANGVRVQRQTESPPAKQAGADVWGYAQEHAQPLVTSVLQALTREGVHLKELTARPGGEPGAWSRAIAQCVAGGECRGGIVFCSDAGLVCCVANKVKGLRAAAVFNVQQAGRALLTLGANLLAVELPGRTFFEMRQIIRCVAKPAACPAGIACVLEELDGHAHR